MSTTQADEHADARRALVWMCVLIAVNQLGFGSIIPVLPLYALSFEVPQSAVGVTIAVYGLARFVVAVPAGQLADRIGRRPVLAIGGLVSALGNLWCGVASSFVELALARFLAGCGAGIVLTMGVVVLADISTPARRGRMMAIYQGTFLFAVGIGPFPGGWLAEHLGLASPFLAYAIAGLGAGAVAWFAVPETRDLATARRGAPAGPRPSLVSQLRVLLAQVGFVLAAGVMFINAVARTGGLFNVVPVLGRDTIGLGTTQIGFGLALGSVVGLAVTYPAGVLVDRLGRKAVIVPSTVLSGVALVLFCLAPTYPWFLAACVAWGVASAASGAAPAAYAADSAPPGMNASAMSTFRMLGDLGYVIGPIALGLVVDLHGPQAAMLLGAGLLVLIGLAFGRFAPETYRAGGR
ncbi:MAG: MFS transporter [Ectothiorhodospiraceae bacterium]|nr:MFS transporter [Chromatiales bacterium]MCP5154152.1 MFS transporter [Ectothiorhodospiraceae bacterium]